MSIHAWYFYWSATKYEKVCHFITFLIRERCIARWTVPMSQCALQPLIVVCMFTNLRFISCLWQVCICIGIFLRIVVLSHVYIGCFHGCYHLTGQSINTTIQYKYNFTDRVARSLHSQWRYFISFDNDRISDKVDENLPCTLFTWITIWSCICNYYLRIYC